MRILTFILLSLISISAQAGLIKVKLSCNAQVFTFQSTNIFTVEVGTGTDSYVKYAAKDGTSEFRVSQQISRADGVYKFTATDDFYMKIDLNAPKGEMITTYEYLWDLQDDANGSKPVGTCRLTSRD